MLCGAQEPRGTGNSLSPNGQVTDPCVVASHPCTDLQRDGVEAERG